MLTRWLRPRSDSPALPPNLPLQVVVTFVNAGYAKSGMLANWVHSLTALGLEEHLLIATLDEESEAVARQLPGTVVRFNADECPNPTTEAIPYKAEGWVPLMFSKVSLVRHLLQEGKHVLYSDVDVVFRRNPLGFFPGEATADFAAQCDARADMPTGKPQRLCAGLYLAHPTPKAIKALTFTPEEMVGMPGDQSFMRKRLGREKVARCVILPRSLFPNGSMWRKNPPPDPVAVHFNWIVGVEPKVEWMKRSGMWVVEGSESGRLRGEGLRLPANDERERGG